MTAVPQPLISAEELHQQLRSAEPPVVLEATFRLGVDSARDEYDEAHLPDAAWVEFHHTLAAPAGDGGRHPLPDVGELGEALRAAGVSADRPVVVYDRAGSLGAARCWWLLTWAGHRDVRVLDGGLAAWTTAGYPLDADPVEPVPGDFVPQGGGREVLDADGAARYARDHVLVDARPADRFRGQNETVDPVAGHVPGAVSLPALEGLDNQGRFLPAEQLRQRLSSVGVRDGEPVGVYCGSGVQAMHTVLAMEAAGVQSPTAVYVGSWSHWVTDPSRPVENPSA